MTHRAALILFGSLCCASLHAQSPTLLVDVYASARAVSVESQPSWIEGGFGRLGLGADDAGDTSTDILGDLRFGFEWRPVEQFAVVANGVARAEPSGFRGDSAGLVEGYLEGRFATLDPSPHQSSGRLRLRLGTFFLPTSRENVEPLWTTPYTITFSAINSWIGEEVRPTGLDADYRLDLPSGQSLALAATMFGGNDTMGTLLAWRGWSMHNRLTVYDEVLPLPPLFSFEDSGPFWRQRDDGTKPFGSDLDDTEGWSARARWEIPDRTLVQYTHLDNRGDRMLYKGEYSWATEFDLVGVEYHPTIDTTFAGEYLSGSAGMGPVFQVQADIEAWYLLASRRFGRWRVTGRYDDFSTTDRDHEPTTESNDDDGRAWTVAAFWDATPSIRLGAEYLDLRADRPAALQSGFDPDTDGRTLAVELRYYWGVTR